LAFAAAFLFFNNKKMENLSEGNVLQGGVVRAAADIVCKENGVGKAVRDAGEAVTNIVYKRDDFREKINALHLRFSEYGRNAKEWAKKCMLLLPEIDKYKVWAKKGFGSIYEYAAKIAGLSRGQVEEGLRVMRKVENRPALRKVVEEKGINAVRPVAAIATDETAEFWAEKARNMSVGELKVYVRDFRRQGGLVGDSNVNDAAALFDGAMAVDATKRLFDEGKAADITTPSFEAFGKQANRSGGRDVPDFQPEKMQVTMELEPEVLNQLKKLKGDGDWNELMKKFLGLREKELEREKPEPVKTESRHVPAEIERYVIDRDCGKCAFPGCDKEYKELHHADSFALRRVHDPGRIFCLCEAHHGLAHRGLIENEHLPAKCWKVRREVNREGVRFGIDRRVMAHRGWRREGSVRG